MRGVVGPERVNVDELLDEIWAQLNGVRRGVARAHALHVKDGMVPVAPVELDHARSAADEAGDLVATLIKYLERVAKSIANSDDARGGRGCARPTRRYELDDDGRPRTKRIPAVPDPAPDAADPVGPVGDTESESVAA